MPLNRHFQGHGSEVMSNMKKTYGPKKAEQVFYATENKMKNREELKTLSRPRSKKRK